MKFAEFKNPYDFSNPVLDEELFIGRTNELKEIDYYLENAKKSKRPINIAILGPRASGKTSLLNITEIKAKNKDFCTVRIDLDEGDAKTQLGFFFKLFDGVFTSVCEKKNAFGGLKGETYDTYLDMVNAYEIPKDKFFCPFLFPLQYAKAMNKRNYNVSLSDNSFKRDLDLIHKTISCPVIILFDEGNILAKSRILLEKIRNIFMNIPGYMLVFTGTSDLFPVMNEVFSPIVRQFKKINVGEFNDDNDDEEGKNCIEKPLEKAGLNLYQISNLIPEESKKEIIDLSGRRPYEIQLISHFLFKRVQSEITKDMRLDFNIIENIIEELEISENISKRPILTEVRRLTKKQLQAVDLLCSCDGQATFDQIWEVEYIFKDEERWSKIGLLNILNHLKNISILSDKGGMIKFAGDDFDKIYTKYFARERKVILNIKDFPPNLELYLFLKLSNYIKYIKNIKSLVFFNIGSIFKTSISIDINDIIKKMLGIKKSKKNISQDLYFYIEDVYFLMIKYRNTTKIPLLHIEIDLEWAKVQSIWYSKKINSNDVNLAIKKLNSLNRRINDLKKELILKYEEVDVIPLNLMKEIIKKSSDKFREKIAKRHIIKMFTEYFKRPRNKNEALFHADLAYFYNSDCDDFTCNNIGYLYLVTEELEKSQILLNKAITISKDDSLLALANYNMGIVELKKNNLELAERLFEKSKKLANSIEEKERYVDVLLIPKVKKGGLVYEEKEYPNMLDASEKSISVIKKLKDRI
jgi:tetratricopeptide (TPR) repeat protein